MAKRASIVDVALSSIRRDMHLSAQSLPCLLSGYLLTYGGLMLLGGRAADLPGRRRVLVGGTALFGISSLGAGLAGNSGILIGSRLAQGTSHLSLIPSMASTSPTPPRHGRDVDRSGREIRRCHHRRNTGGARRDRRAGRLAAQRLQQLGAALEQAIFAAIATSRTDHLLTARAVLPKALTSGFFRALLATRDWSYRTTNQEDNQ